MSTSLGARQASSSGAPRVVSSSSTNPTSSPRVPSSSSSSLLSVPAPGGLASSSSSSRSRHSLYGVDDRVVLDLGSRVWKVGFSGESAPRAVFDIGELWTLDLAQRTRSRELERRFKRWLRRVFYNELMVDPKARRVLVLENPMLPLRVKETVAKVLFDCLSVPSLSFASSPLCSLLSIGRITGLVIDIGHLETSLLPIYSSRPLFSHLATTPIASLYLSKHLGRLLKRYALYIPTSINPSSTTTGRRIVNPVADDVVVTPAVVEEIKTRACYVEPEAPDDHLRPHSAAKHTINSDSIGADGSQDGSDAVYQEYLFERLRRRYTSAEEPSQATSLSLRLSGGTLTVPGWLRHACADIYFDSSGDVDAPSLPELLLDTLLKLPIDLRKVFVSGILLVGGGSMLPGFPLRLVNSIHNLLHREKRYQGLRGLSRSIHVVNGGGIAASTSAAGRPLPGLESETSDASGPEVGETADFCWERSLLPWVGASLIGALKAGGNEEWTRAAWDAAKESGAAIGDWTNTRY